MSRQGESLCKGPEAREVVERTEDGGSSELHPLGPPGATGGLELGIDTITAVFLKRSLLSLLLTAPPSFHGPVAEQGPVRRPQPRPTQFSECWQSLMAGSSVFCIPTSPQQTSG